MLTAVGAAVIAAVASLVGVTLGALVEPVKLNAARRAKLRQDRADRCAGLIEAATRARKHIIDINVIHRRRELGKELETDAQREIEFEDGYYTARTDMRAFYGLLVMSGPDELVEQANLLRRKEMELHHTRWELDDSRKFDRKFLPTPVREASAAFDRAIEDFALVARKHTS
ncbi:hypothetical protein [Amycolatopsis sp. DG1A-15b]|uniref:hypothetical protein n=1 Tax=Amycolatopsis sp. DG1A-15b TaxID=3052846 RepID=UPI00255BF6DC|nr:hypothetical protein [Amycolatopsis sp. DG1A-15b]WIX85425.1 hypothetical protein QRY02_29845 [Amycolatopsis sp. DG1A-15b]